MKNILIAIVFVAAGSLANAAGYGEAGCGLGSAIVGAKGGQIFAATTNGTFWNQSFAISAGSLNCVPDGKTANRDKAAVFVAANRVSVADDVARGNGETVAVISSMLGCQDSSAVKAVLKDNFRTIFSGPEVTPLEITDSVIEVLEKDSRTSTTCGQLS